MELKLDTTPWTTAEGDWLIVGVTEDLEQDRHWGLLDSALQGQLTRLRESRDLTGKAGETLTIHDVPGLAAQRLLLVGLGPKATVNERGVSKALMTSLRMVTTRDKQRVAVGVPTNLEGKITPEIVSHAAQCGVVAGMGQDLYKGERCRFPLTGLQLLVNGEDDIPSLQQAATEGKLIGEAINLARELVNQPPNVVYPASFAERAERLAKENGVKCNVLDLAALKKERMGSMLAVAQGSAQDPRLVVLEYDGVKEGPILGICGKGVTFDSGGLSLKSNENMLTMKCDMAGAATTLAAVLAMAQLKLPVRVRGLMGLVENMPSGTSFKLGDILTSRSGITIENLNTDAEGRLVLADVLNYALDLGVDYLVDLATLTGAVVVALGEDVTGAFTNNQEWCAKVVTAADKSGEDIWQLPMFEFYSELLKSDVADVKNVGGRWGGAITAAKFLEKFVGGKPWVHLDIAGPAFASSAKPYREGGATGCLVRTLVELGRGVGK